uniref:G_PROTEIN_RECEP_F1_2 domain-containing protein n=1 Tax=Parastrongyloides trichosuri TaxID=131310 RepID=A0A0N4Z3K2_PARTI
MYTVTTSVPIVFMYRYSIIVTNNPWTKTKFYLSVVISILLVQPINILGFPAYLYDPSKFDEKASHLDKKIWFNDDIQKYRLFVISENNNISTTISLFYVFFLVCLEYFIIFFCSISVKRAVEKACKMKTNNNAHKRDKNNRQINNVLLTQALIPIIFIIIPYIFFILCVILKARFIVVISPLMWSHISWIPTTEAIATIFLIKEFKQGIFTFWKKEVYKETTRTISKITTKSNFK